MSVNLCARVNFRLRRVVRNDVGYVSFISAHRTQVNNEGDCKLICAELALDPGRGVLGVAITSDGKVCFGGFANVGGKVTGALRGVLAGHIVIFFSVTDCDPLQTGLARAVDCTQPPGAAPLCYVRPAPQGWVCIYCVDNGEYPRPTCTIEQDTVSYPCDAHALPGGGPTIMPYGATVTPQPGHWDIHGDDGPFYANYGITGLVRYYLQPVVRAHVNPLFDHPDDPAWCERCWNWMCCFVTHYLSSAWNLYCTDVLPMPAASDEGACCLPDGTCEDGYKEGLCLSFGGIWRGPGSRCECVDCSAGITDKRPCCLPDGTCLDLTPENCQCMGGTVIDWAPKCENVNCEVNDPNLNPRLMELYFQEPIGFVQFSFEGTPRCFRLQDNYCFTSGPDSGACGGSPCWQHIGLGNVEPLRLLDSLTTHCQFRFAETSGDEVNAYPHAEPECVQIANKAFEMVGDLLLGLTNHQRMNSYDKPTLNRWTEHVHFDCRDAPVVWDVSVIPYKTACAFPAELVLTDIGAVLHLSIDPGNARMTDPGHFGQVRIAAVFKCQVQLAVRLKPGWESIDCPIRVVNEIGSPCDPVLSDPNRYVIIASDACTRVPLSLTWKGIHGPAPWGKYGWAYEAKSATGIPCCDALCAIDGLVIPGAVNDTNDPNGTQRYDGDVVLLLNWNRHEASVSVKTEDRNERARRAREQFYLRVPAGEAGEWTELDHRVPKFVQLGSPTIERAGRPCPKRGDGLLKKAQELARVLASGNVPDEVFDERMSACRDCPYTTVAKGHHWCGCCGCPKWQVGSVGSSLEYKNRKSAWLCARPAPAFGPWFSDVI